jgi:TonB family protein
MKLHGPLRLASIVFCLAMLAGCATGSSGTKPQPAVVFPGALPTHPLRQPEYPDASRRNGDQGLVGVDVLVGEDGRVKDAKIVMSSGHAALDASTQREALTWRFRPGQMNGKATQMWSTFTITFSLDDKNRPMPDQTQALAEMRKMSEQRKAALEAEAAAMP